jgi:hypothetical protein
MITALLPLALFACSDYDLKRDADVEPADTADPAPPEEEEDLGPAPDIELSPATVDFGWVPRDCTSDPVEVTVTNVGEELLVVDDIALGGSGEAYFEMIRPQLPLELGPGESDVLTVQFSPISTNTLEARVEVTSNDPDEPVAGVDMSGTGADDPIYEETFSQDVYSEVDVLWIIDNSGSMSDALDEVRSKFESFITKFDDLGLDYHMGVVTTDMDNPSQSGRLQGNPTYVTADTADGIDSFLAAVDQGSTGSGIEKGFDAAYAALTDPLVNGFNAGFLRGDEVALAIIVVSDENDSSSISYSSFSSWLDGLKPDPYMTSFSALVGDSGFGCTGGKSWTDLFIAEAGTKYINAVDATGGVFQSICSDNFDDALTYLSLGAVGMKYSWELTEEPTSVGTMVVTVNGEEVEYGSLDGWTYDATTNSIVFHGDAVPPPDSVIYVEYSYGDECPT